jgi:NAD(P)-dependent dehydrogenase (short-subunit alcohol dehydrogenase family)
MQNSKINPLAVFDLSDKVALVTGGTTGIGRATAELFHAAGARVAITGQNEDTLAAARRELPEDVLVLHADVRSIADSARAVERIRSEWGKIDVLFLNAGIAKLAPFEAVDEAFYDEHMAVNVKGVVFTLKQALPILAPGASVIVTTSLAGQRGASHMSIYAATKGAVAALVRTLALELAPRNIRVNSLSPGTVHTRIQPKFGLPAEVQASLEREFAKKIPLGRFGQAAEVAAAALFLASPAAAYVTGIELEVDGGLSAVV